MPSSGTTRRGFAQPRPRIRPVRPFLLLSSRAEDVAADDEYAAFLRVTGLPPERLRRIRMEAAPLPAGPRRLRGGLPRRQPVQLQRPGGEQVRRPAPGRAGAAARCWTRSSSGTSRSSAPATASGRSGVHQGGVVDRTYAEADLRRPDAADRGGAGRSGAGRAGAGVRRLRRPQGGLPRAAAARGPAGVLGRLPGADVPGQEATSTPRSSTRSSTCRGWSPGSTSTSTPATSRRPSWRSSSPGSAPRWSPSRAGCWPTSSPATADPRRVTPASPI